MKYDHYHQYFLRIYTLTELLNKFEFHHFQNDFFLNNNLNKMLVILLFYLVLFFLANAGTFLSKPSLFMNPETADLSTNSFFFYLSMKCLTYKFIVISCSKIFRFNVIFLRHNLFFQLDY